MSSEIQVFAKPGDLTAYLNRAKSSLAMALPKHLNPERMVRLAVTAFSTTPKLRECTGESILASLMVAAQIGLEPGIAGQGYLIPHFNSKRGVSECTFVPGWQGLVGLLNNSGRATAWTGSVFDGDEWNFELGSNPKCQHRPGPNYGDPDKLIWVYACGQVNGSQMPVIEAWPIARVVKHRDKFNKVGNRHYSFTHFEMYSRKVVLLQVLKYMPRSIELNNAIVAADAAEMGGISRVEEGVVIDIAPQDEIPEGTVGTSKSPLKSAKRTQQTLPPEGEQKKPSEMTEPPDDLPLGQPEEKAKEETQQSPIAALRSDLRRMLGLQKIPTGALGKALVKQGLLPEWVPFEGLTIEALTTAKSMWADLLPDMIES